MTKVVTLLGVGHQHASQPQTTDLGNRTHSPIQCQRILLADQISKQIAYVILNVMDIIDYRIIVSAFVFQTLIQRRKEVEERTLASSERGLGLLFESEKVGSATAVELTRQKEQLLNTESKLDEINSSLRQSERHLQGIRSVFGSVRNYFSGRSASAANTGNTPASAPGANRNAGPSPGPGQSSYNDFNNRVSQSHNNISGSVQQQKQMQQGHQSYSSAVDEQVDRNLDDMASSLARLKGLAQGLNTELDEHNDIMDRVADKADTVGFKVDKQNKDMGKILKK